MITLLLILALICFICAACNVKFGSINLTPLGLAFYILALIFPLINKSGIR